MKLVVILAVVLGLGALFGTRRDTPFMRWGIILALAGLLLMLFAFRGAIFGVALALIGVGAYYFGRLARKEQLFVGKPK